jgi:hypothetical protein
MRPRSHFSFCLFVYIVNATLGLAGAVPSIRRGFYEPSLDCRLEPSVPARRMGGREFERGTQSS